MIEKSEVNRHGELIKVVKGIWCGPKAVVTRLYEWTVKLRREEPDDQTNISEDGTGFGAALSTDPPGACATLEFCQ